MSNMGLMGILMWLKETYGQKKTNTEFTASDVQGYLSRKRLPDYLGGYYFEEVNSKYTNRKWNVVKFNN